MFDRKRPFWQSAVLHAALVAGSLVFALPYAWLVGTSWKLDKEIQSGEVKILPERPLPTPVSPYVGENTFPPISRPDFVDSQRWSDWMERQITAQIHRAVSAWQDPRLAGVSESAARAELAEGVYKRLGGVIATQIWQTAEAEQFAAVVEAQITPKLIQACFEEAYRYLAVGQVKLVTEDYQMHVLTGDGPATQSWQVESGQVALKDAREADQPVALAAYDLNTSPRFAVVGTFSVPVELADPVRGFKRLEVSYRNDETWHDLRVEIEMAGKLYRSTEPRYLAGDQWGECLFQLPSADDDRLIPHRYILLKPAGQDPRYDHGPGTLKVRLSLERSGLAEAMWAKGTENYRRAFDEVPFWRYFQTSVFLVVANIVGMVLSCSLAAYAFARLHWPGRDLCFLLVLATLMIPPQVTMIPSFVIYKHLGWYNTLAPLWVPNCLAVNGFGIFLLRQAMKGIPKDLEEAAKIDGCGHLRIWWSIILPLVKPTLAAISIFTFMAVWNDFMTPLIYVNDQRLYPLALGLFSFVVGRENQFTLIMAGSVIMTLPVIIIFFLAQRHFIQGVAMSGMKN